MKSAELGQKMTGEEQRLAQMMVISGAASVYYSPLMAEREHECRSNRHNSGFRSETVK